MPDGKMDPFPQAVGHLNDWYYAYFSNARLAPAAQFPVYQRDLFKTSGFLVNYGSKAHDIGGLGRNEIGGVVAGIPYSIVGARSTYSQIPCEMEQGNNCAEQGIKSAHQGSFPPDQGRPSGSDRRPIRRMRTT